MAGVGGETGPVWAVLEVGLAGLAPGLVLSSWVDGVPVIDGGELCFEWVKIDNKDCG